MSEPLFPEVWKIVPTLPGHEASNIGRVRSYWSEEKITKRLKSGRLRKYIKGKLLNEPAVLKTRQRNSQDAVFVKVFRKRKFVWRTVGSIVLEAFHGVRKSHLLISIHRDGDGRNNHESNLFWGTRAECNLLKNQRSGRQKLTEENVVEIWKQLKAGVQQRLISARFKVSESVVSNIKARRKWTSVTEKL